MFSIRRSASSRRHRATHFWLVVALLAAATLCAGSNPAAAAAGAAQTRLSGHVLPALAQATAQPQSWRKWLTGSDATDAEPLTLTVVLRRDDEAGFQNYLHEVYDPASSSFRQFLTPAQIAERFGPSQQAYDDTLAWLRGQGAELAEGSANRMTLTVGVSRGVAAQMFATDIGDYRYGERSFHANRSDPALPAAIAAHVQSIAGLSDLAQAEAPDGRTTPLNQSCPGGAGTGTGGKTDGNGAKSADGNGGSGSSCPAKNGGVPGAVGAVWCSVVAVWLIAFVDTNNGTASNYANDVKKAIDACFKQNLGKSLNLSGGSDPPPPAWQGSDGSGQTVGIVAFDTFQQSDVADYVNLLRLPASVAGNVSEVHVAGGFGATPGAGQDEVLLDIDDVITIAHGAKVVVFDAPRGTSFQAIFNAMINDRVDIISNSWAYCEDQTTLADVTGIDAVLQTAAAAGISVFSGAGDSGSTCMDGSAATAAVPADSPNLTAVGGTSLSVNTGLLYGKETWWDGSGNTPPTGQGGFGTSRFFARPAYQAALNASSARSIPDVSTNADPAYGMVICAAALGGCPTGQLYGGTSSSTPLWAGFTALLNQSQGSHLGLLNAQIYPFANTRAFFTPASMGSDFAHVGLGSPNLANLHEALTGQTTGPVDASVSEARAFLQNNNLVAPEGVPMYVPADGATQAFIVVRLADAYGNIVSGKTVSLAGSGSATITPASAVSDTNNGAVTFAVTDLTAETITFTVHDATDGVALSTKPVVTFIAPAAASASIAAVPTSVPADGSSTSTITVTLQDSLGRPAPGKLVVLAQTGNSVVSGPNPSVTAANGQIVFTATDDRNETVTYTAVDANDGNLPVPGSAVVTFSNAVTSNCNGAPPVAAAGYSVSTFSSGFAAGDFFYSNVNFGGCPGAGNPTFVGSGVIIPDFNNGNLYALGVGGGAVSSSNVLSSPGRSIGNLVFGLDGNLYATRFVTGSGFYSGEVVQIDPATGAIVRTLASGQTCPNGLAVDPLSGDLFFDDQCYGGGSDNPSVWRLSNPGSASPTQTVYATLPGSGGQQQLAFAPNGTLYASTGSPSAIVRISGTNSASPATVTPLNISIDCCGLAVGKTQPNGDARTLLVHKDNSLETIDITVTPATVDTVLATGNIAVGSVGPDGCLYSGTNHLVYKIANSTSACTNTPTSPGSTPTLSLSPASVSPNPAQGTTQIFTAVLSDLTVPAGTPVYFTVFGANAQARVVPADASGHAALSYAAVNAGADDVVASITIGTSTYTSNTVHVVWNAGPHTTFLTLNPSPLGATAGQTVALAAALTDVSVNPIAALAGQTVAFSLGGAGCSATTDANGIASCAVAAGGAGAAVLSAHFAGTSNFLPSSDTSSFYALATVVPASTTTTLTATPNPVSAGHALTLTATVTSSAPAGIGRSAPAATSTPAAATGNVIFTDNGNALISVALSPGGQAMFTTSSLTAGAHSLVATYGGDANDAPSTSPAVVVNVTAVISAPPIAAPALTWWALLCLVAAIAALAAVKRHSKEPSRS